MFGDRASDLEAARAAGIPTRVLLATDGAGEPARVPDGLATHRYARLDQALADVELAGRLGAMAGS